MVAAAASLCWRTRLSITVVSRQILPRTVFRSLFALLRGLSVGANPCFDGSHLAYDLSIRETR